MSIEHEIAMEKANTMIESGKEFSYEELKEEILISGGILRTTIGVTVKEYLKDLLDAGIIEFNKTRMLYKKR